MKEQRADPAQARQQGIAERRASAAGRRPAASAYAGPEDRQFLVVRHLGRRRVGAAAPRAGGSRRVIVKAHVALLNSFRYSHESRLRKHLNDIGYYERGKRGSDTLKVACIELMDAALAIRLH